MCGHAKTLLIACHFVIGFFFFLNLFQSVVIALFKASEAFEIGSLRKRYLPKNQLKVS